MLPSSSSSNYSKTWKPERRRWFLRRLYAHYTQRPLSPVSFWVFAVALVASAALLIALLHTRRNHLQQLRLIRSASDKSKSQFTALVQELDRQRAAESSAETALRSSVEELSQRVRQLQGDVQINQGALQRAEHDRDSSALLAEQALKESMQHESGRSECRDALDSAETRLDEVTQKYAALQQAERDMRSIVSTLRNDLVEQQNSRSAMEQQLAACQDELNDRQTQLDHVRQQLHEWRDILSNNRAEPGVDTILAHKMDSLASRSQHGKTQTQQGPESSPLPSAAAGVGTVENVDNVPESPLLPTTRSSSSAEQRREDVKTEFLWAWDSYKRFAWGEDEVKPISQTGTGGYHMGLTIIDAMDTILLMGLKDEYQLCREFVRTHLFFGSQSGINLFETTIRVMGGLLATHSLTGDVMLVDKAKALADSMLFAFDSPTHVPFSTLDLNTKRGYNPSWSGEASTVAEVGSIQMEWQYLSRVTGNPVYRNKVDAVSEHLDKMDVPDGLYPMFISPNTGKLASTTITFGARVDSLYEYFLKQWILSGGKNKRALKMYRKSMKGMIDHLITHSIPSGLAYIAEIHGSTKHGKMDHLVCFMPGLLALGSKAGIPEAAEHLKLARELMDTCYEFYRRAPTGLAPEIIQFQGEHDFVVDPNAAHSLLRPETVESLFVMWRVTKDPRYRDMAWNIFGAFKRYARVPSGGYSSLRTVEDKSYPPERMHDPTYRWGNWRDHTESFFLSETLKYLYLIFCDDDVLPLDEFVFNTEAHALRIARPGFPQYKPPASGM